METVPDPDRIDQVLNELRCVVKTLGPVAATANTFEKRITALERAVAALLASAPAPKPMRIGGFKLVRK